MTVAAPPPTATRTLIDELLAEQQALTAVERFARWHEVPGEIDEPAYRRLLPASSPRPGQQYAFEVNLDQCSGCKACVTACHSLNGLEETETWRSVGLLLGELTPASDSSFQQHVTTACHHCADPGCLNGCPVLAYDKDPVSGIVRHLDDQCIGCQYCMMKCPYEVPKYSKRLGIVRKCDLCHSRLAIGEAPACVQACPNEAIRITIVETESVRSAYRSQGRAAGGKAGKWDSGRSGDAHKPNFSPGHFLPDSPNPALTLPTTRFVSRKAPCDLRAADHASPRRDQSHWPLVIMLVLTQSAAGLFFSASFVKRPAPLHLAGFGLLVAGLVASVAHLGQPLKAWRAFLGWRKSWLSREIIAFNAFAIVAALTLFLGMRWPNNSSEPPTIGGSDRQNPELQTALTFTTALLGLIAVFASAMVYADTGRTLWSPRFSFGSFFGTTFLLGATFTTTITGWVDRLGVARPFAMAALVLFGALFTWRRFVLRTAWREPSSRIHLNARVVYELLPWTIPAQNKLFLAVMLFGSLTIFNPGAAPWWASLTAITTLAAEIVARHVFFAASADKRMPGGVAA